MALLLLPLLAFVAANDGRGVDHHHQNSMTDDKRKAVNGTELLLECPQAAYLVRTHMAPDFEHPQLVRRLDWIHDGALIASYQQEFPSADGSQQWWVSEPRFTLRRPFFELRIAPLLPHDAGRWVCRMETDPLFEPELPPRGYTELLVLVRPPVPPRPVVSGHSDHSVSLQWGDQFSPSAAHLPIIRFSILVAKPDDGSLRVVSTPNNATHIKVEGLQPNTQYSFSVRSENSVGESAFGPETVFRTIGQPPRSAPQIVSIRNGTNNPNCVELSWKFPDPEKEVTPLVGFRVMVHRVGSGAMREWYVKGSKASQQQLCSLEVYADYVLTLEADNGFGYSPGATMPFRTDESVPDGPPQLIEIRPIPGGEALFLTWREPLMPNGLIREYVIYYKDVPSQREMIRLSLPVSPSEPSKAFAYNLTKLIPNTRYKIHLSAATSKGEGVRSDTHFVDTDFSAPHEPPKVTNLSYDCDGAQLQMYVSMSPSEIGPSGQFRVTVLSSLGPTRMLNLTTATSESGPHKLSIGQLQQGERLSLTVIAAVQSRADPKLWLESPPSAPAHFVLLANGWRCHFRSSTCPLANSLPDTTICEHFAAAPSSSTSQQLITDQNSDQLQKGDANGPFIFLIFGAAITLAISSLFTCILRRRCILFKSFLRRKKDKKHKRGPSLAETRPTAGQKRPESVSLVQRGTNDVPDSVVLPPITLPNGAGAVTMFSSSSIEGDESEQSGDNNGGGGSCCATVGDDASGAKQGPVVSVLHFDAYFEEMNAQTGAGFRRQFREIEQETVALLEREQEDEAEESSRSLTSPCSLTNNDREKAKNRYIDVNALPRKSRIRLADRKGCRQHYINANYVDSCDEKKAYVATQAPLPNTFADFWAMVWQERSQVLVALTNMVESGRKKCDQYWPDRVGEFVQAEEFRITLSAERTNSVFTHRILSLGQTYAGGTVISRRGEDYSERTVHQLHFMAWPDHGVPDSPFPLLHFINYVAELQSAPPAAGGPCVVHCSAGVGRSGAFILIDSLRRHLLHCDRIDVAGQLRRMRHQRAQLVQTLEQYVFCHEVLRHLVANGITRQPRAHFANYVRFLLSQRTPAGQRRIRAQYLDLLACTHRPTRCPPPACCVPLAGYHRNDEFLFCGLPGNSAELWRTLWHNECRALLLLDSNVDGPTNFATVPDHFMDADQKPVMISRNGEEHVQMSRESDGKELCIRLHRIQSASLLHKPWLQIERLQGELQQQHRAQLAVLEMGSAAPSAVPFLFCTLQSAACQLEQEGAVDVLLWLALYKQAVCGCWTEQGEVELVYRKVLELVELQKTLC